MGSVYSKPYNPSLTQKAKDYLGVKNNNLKNNIPKTISGDTPQYLNPDTDGGNTYFKIAKNTPVFVSGNNPYHLSAEQGAAISYDGKGDITADLYGDGIVSNNNSGNIITSNDHHNTKIFNNDDGTVTNIMNGGSEEIYGKGADKVNTVYPTDIYGNNGSSGS